MPANPGVVTVAALQMPFAGSRDATLDVAEQMIRQCVSEQHAQVICLQELVGMPYPCQAEDHVNFQYAEPVDGVTVQRMQAVAAELAAVIVVPIFEKRAAGVYHNTAVVVDADGSIAGIYRKMHLPDDPLYYEKFYFTPGDLGFRPIQSRYAKLGVLICWDQWFPEAARLMALAGAEILLYPTAIGWIQSERDEYGDDQFSAWQTSMRAHAIANGLFVVAANRIGQQGDVDFWGGSFIADPNGRVIQQANHDDPATLVADCQLEQIDVVRTHWPFLRDRRIDAYQGLTQRLID